jgi:hypothetical protein
MDTHTNRPEDLNALERRLSSWEPANAGLDVEAMLFAAGRASVRPSLTRFTWPTLTVLMAALSVALGLWLTDERSERLALALRLRERPPMPVVNPSPPPAANMAAEETPQTDELPPDGYLVSRRALEQGLDAWPIRAVVRAEPTEPAFMNPPILRLGQRDALLEP